MDNLCYAVVFRAPDLVTIPRLLDHTVGTLRTLIQLVNSAVKLVDTEPLLCRCREQV
jgi:hypothetical protein